MGLHRSSQLTALGGVPGAPQNSAPQHRGGAAGAPGSPLKQDSTPFLLRPVRPAGSSQLIQSGPVTSQAGGCPETPLGLVSAPADSFPAFVPGLPSRLELGAWLGRVRGQGRPALMRVSDLDPEASKAGWGWRPGLGLTPVGLSAGPHQAPKIDPGLCPGSPPGGPGQCTYMGSVLATLWAATAEPQWP